MPADPEKKALAEKLVREEKARWKAEWLEGQRIKKCASGINLSVGHKTCPWYQA